MDSNHSNEPLLIIISSPSGAGKTSVCRLILDSELNIKISISATTRAARQNEINGMDYYFITKEEFNSKVNNDEFIEYAEVFGNFYGSLKKDVNLLISSGNDVLFDIDWQGAQQLLQSNPSNIVSIFILPPSKEEIQSRLKMRQEDSGDNDIVTNSRMKKFKDEVSHWVEYDYVVINNNLDECSHEIISIIDIERKKRYRQKKLVNIVRDLVN